MTEQRTARLGDVLCRSREITNIETGREYKQLTVRLWGRGVVERRSGNGKVVAGSRRMVARKGQLVLSRIDARNGAFGIVPDELDGAVVSNDFPVFEIEDELLSPAYLEWLTRTPEFVEKCRHASEGTTNRVRLKEERFLGIEFRLPRRDEQDRIARWVEGCSADAAALRVLVERRWALLRRFRQSVLSAACSGRSTSDWRRDDGPGEGELPEGWANRPLESACFAVVDCPHSTPRWTESGEICVRTSDLRPGAIDLSGVRYVSAGTYAERTKRLVPMPGDIVYSREGTIGTAAIIPPGVKLCLGQRTMLMRANTELAVPEFVALLLNSPVVLAQAAEFTRGTTSFHVNIGDVKLFELPMPPLAEQREIVRRVEALFSLADAIDSRIEAATGRAERLTQSILAKAFRGELA